MCSHVHISVTKCCIVGDLSDALWDLWDGTISLYGQNRYLLFVLCKENVKQSLGSSTLSTQMLSKAVILYIEPIVIEHFL